MWDTGNPEFKDPMIDPQSCPACRYLCCARSGVGAEGCRRTRPTPVLRQLPACWRDRKPPQDERWPLYGSLRGPYAPVGQPGVGAQTRGSNREGVARGSCGPGVGGAGTPEEARPLLVLTTVPVSPTSSRQPPRHPIESFYPTRSCF